MILIPAIDLKDGKCVRLRQGVMQDDTVFSHDPLEVAQRWVDAGARRLPGHGHALPHLGRAGHAHLGDQDRVLPHRDVVRKVDQVVDLRAAADWRAGRLGLEGGAAQRDLDEPGRPGCHPTALAT